MNGLTHPAPAANGISMRRSPSAMKEWIIIIMSVMLLSEKQMIARIMMCLYRYWVDIAQIQGISVRGVVVVVVVVPCTGVGRGHIISNMPLSVRCHCPELWGGVKYPLLPFPPPSSALFSRFCAFPRSSASPGPPIPYPLGVSKLQGKS